MPTTKYRISVPLDPHVRDAFQAMADVMGKSLGATISDWLGETAESAQFVTAAMVKAKESPAVALRQLQEAVEYTQATMADAQKELRRMALPKAAGGSPKAGGGAATGRRSLPAAAPKRRSA